MLPTNSNLDTNISPLVVYLYEEKKFWIDQMYATNIFVISLEIYLEKTIDRYLLST